MKSTPFPVPIKEPEQIRESLSFEADDSGTEHHHAQIINFGSRIFTPSVSLANLSGHCKQWFKVVLGLTASNAPTAPLRSRTEEDAPMYIVKEAASEEKEEAVYFNSSFNAEVRKRANVQFNHMFPLKSSDENSDGAVGIIDTRERNPKLRTGNTPQPDKADKKRINKRGLLTLRPEVPDASEERADALRSETEQLARMGSWEYAEDAQAFFCTAYVPTLLKAPKDKGIDDFNTFIGYFAEEARTEIMHTLNLARRSGKEQSCVSLLAHAQEKTWVRLMIKPVYKDARLLKVIGTLQDVTDYKERESRLLSQTDKAEQDIKVKSEFVSLMSHEIRTPLNAIMGLTHLLLQEENIAQEHKVNLHSIHFSSQNMLSLINNTLDFSRVEAGKIELEKVNFHLPDLLKNIHRSLSIRAAEKKLRFDLCIHENTPSEVAGDPARLTQILNNLMSNAIKFTSKGSVTLSVDVVYQSDDDWVLEFTVADTGVGIPVDRQQHIFESFVQASVATHRQYGGTGLGLAITKKLVELHKGNIMLKSKPGEGSVFTVRLRYVKPDISLDSLKLNSPAENPYATLTGARVLVVDDNALNNMVASKLLVSWQAEVETAEDGFAALEKIRSAAAYDLVLMDLHMPAMNGFDAIAEIRKLGYTMPIIALTANASTYERKRILAIGGNDYLTKPFVPQELHDKIQQHLQPVCK